jgi:hypothetical protein
MIYRIRQTIDMTPAGEFLPRPMALPWTAKLGIAAALVALTAGVVAVAAVFLWVASLLLPVALAAAVVAYAAFKLQPRRKPL